MWLLNLSLIVLPSIIFYICAWRTKKRALQIIFGLLTLISPIIIICFWSLWWSTLYPEYPEYLTLIYIVLSIFILIYALVSTIVFKKSKRPVPIIPIVIGIIIMVSTISSYLYIQYYLPYKFEHEYPMLLYPDIVPPVHSDGVRP